MTILEKTQKELAAEEAVRQAKARLARVKREEREKMRKEQNHHKYMMGGVVAKCFPEGYSAYDFSELEMNRIIACAFSLRDVRNMISLVISERVGEDQTEDSNNSGEVDEE